MSDQLDGLEVVTHHVVNGNQVAGLIFLPRSALDGYDSVSIRTKYLRYTLDCAEEKGWDIVNIYIKDDFPVLMNPDRKRKTPVFTNAREDADMMLAVAPCMDVKPADEVNMEPTVGDVLEELTGENSHINIGISELNEKWKEMVESE